MDKPVTEEKEKQIRIPLSLHKLLKEIAKEEGKLLERISIEIIQAGIDSRNNHQSIKTAV